MELEPDGSDAWRADKVLDIIRSGGVGVLPTDTCYAFVTSVDSKEGVERILRIKVLGPSMDIAKPSLRSRCLSD